MKDDRLQSHIDRPTPFFGLVAVVQTNARRRGGNREATSSVTAGGAARRLAVLFLLYIRFRNCAAENRAGTYGACLCLIFISTKNADNILKDTQSIIDMGAMKDQECGGRQSNQIVEIGIDIHQSEVPSPPEPTLSIRYIKATCTAADITALIPLHVTFIIGPSRQYKRGTDPHVK